MDKFSKELDMRSDVRLETSPTKILYSRRGKAMSPPFFSNLVTINNNKNLKFTKFYTTQFSTLNVLFSA